MTNMNYRAASMDIVAFTKKRGSMTTTMVYIIHIPAIPTMLHTWLSMAWTATAYMNMVIAPTQTHRYKSRLKLRPTG